jgi:hypothetical protein
MRHQDQERVRINDCNSLQNSTFDYGDTYSPRRDKEKLRLGVGRRDPVHSGKPLHGIPSELLPYPVCLSVYVSSGESSVSKKAGNKRYRIDAFTARLFVCKLDLYFRHNFLRVVVASDPITPTCFPFATEQGRQALEPFALFLRLS